MIYDALIKKYGINHERVIHSLGVRDMAVKLANKLGVDPKKAEIAALFHDYYRYEDNDTLLKIMTEDDRKMYYGRTYMYHGLAAANALFTEFGIDDKEISDAIRFHTSGRIGMTDLEKILFVADFAEVNRKHEGAREVREMLDGDFDLVLYTTISLIVKHLKKVDNETADMLKYYQREKRK